MKQNVGCDHFHWINHTGLLDVGEIKSIARERYGSYVEQSKIRLENSFVSESAYIKMLI